MRSGLERWPGEKLTRGDGVVCGAVPRGGRDSSPGTGYAVIVCGTVGAGGGVEVRARLDEIRAQVLRASVS